MVAKGIAVDIEDDTLWLGAYGYFGPESSLCVLKYSLLDGNLIGNTSIVQGAVNGGDIASGDECIWVTVLWLDDWGNVHHEIKVMDKETMQITRTIEVLGGEFGIALQ